MPSGKKARAEANLAALSTLHDLRQERREPTAEELNTLAQWSSWGAVPEIFESHREDWAELHTRAKALMSPREWDAARTTTLNAHYTDPDVARLMWEFLQNMHASDGSLPAGPYLEPGCGTGTFMLKAPQPVEMIGVELDPISAEIATYLNPTAQIRNEGFEKTRFSAETPSFAGAVGNVPFGGFSLHDPIDNPMGLSIHNHFIVKSLKHIAPGGFAALLTSSFTMDAQRSTARREMSELADLIGAIRLPSGAMSQVAGTEVVTDILLFRRRPDGQEPADTTWVDGRHVLGDDPEGNQVTINQYWADNPGNVLGEHRIDSGMYGQATVLVDGAVGPEMIDTLHRQIGQLAANQWRRGVRFEPQGLDSPADATPGLLLPNPTLENLMPGHVREVQGTFAAWNGQGWEPVRVPRNRMKETRALLTVRDALNQVIATQNDSTTSSNVRDAARQVLTEAYDTYVAEYGPINRFEWSAPRPVTQARIDRAVNAATRAWRAALPEDMSPDDRAAAIPGDDLIAEWAADVDAPAQTKLRRHLDPLRDDPAFGGLLALEVFDDDTGNAVKTRIFTGDIITPPTARTHAETPRDAVAISLDELGRIDAARVAELLNVEPDDVPGLIEPFTFTDHITGDLVPEWTYLSGDVRAKHAQVQELIAQGRDDLTANAEALNAVLPEWLSLEDIAIRPGAPWIPAQDLHAFSEQVLGVTMQVYYNDYAAEWQLDESVGKTLFAPDVRMQFETMQKSVKDLWLAALNNRAVNVTKEVEMPDGKVRRRNDPAATRAARERVQALTEAFATWLVTQEDRVSELEKTYNAQFNSYRAPDYFEAGKALTLDGLSEAITPHDYQLSAVARAINEPTVLLDHVVGAGKTGTMIMSAMELRRSGVANKPWVVVPNHLVEQTASEWATWYPGANVLTIPTGINKQQRARYIAASAAGDWDAVVIPQTVFEAIPITKTRADAWAAEHVAAHRAEAERSGQRTKTVEAQVQRIEKSYQTYLAGKDASMPFEASGCDYLIVDEAHHYKNLARVSDYPDLACSPGSQRAMDLDFKLRALRESKIEAAERSGMDTSNYRPAVALFATGTPVANALSELWVMQKYLQPELLKELGIDTVDAWARTFTTSTSKMELGPDGSTWRLRARVNQLVNAPEIINMVGRFTDRVDRSMVPSRLPELHGGQRQILSQPRSPQVADYMVELAKRANNLPDDPSVDNLLKITYEGRMIALDPRTLGLDAPTGGGRVQQVADAVMEIHRDTEHNTYRDATGAISPTPGALQLVFCDRSVPQGDGSFSVYEALADELVAQGLDRDKIAFIHDAEDDTARAELFSKCRTGEVNVLIGSTEKMGTGVNVQNRAVALHHMDCPWRPADLEQREGRIIRQGNQNERVHIRQYVTEGTYDAVMWQIVANKAAFIAQTKAVSAHRHFSAADDDMQVSAAGTAAVATGDPRIVERAELLEELQSLEALRNAHYSQVRAARTQAQVGAVRMETLTGLIATYENWQHNATGEGFVTQGGRRGASNREVGELVVSAFNSHAPELKNGQTPQIGTIAGLPLFASAGLDLQNQWRFSMHLGTPDSVVATYPDGLPSQWSPTGIGTRVSNLLTAIETQKQNLQAEHARLVETVPEFLRASQTEFAMADKLTEIQTRLDAIDAELTLTDEETTQATDMGPSIKGTDLANVARGVVNDGRLETYYGQNTADVLRTGDVITNVQSARTVLFDVEIRTEEIDGNTIRNVYLRPTSDTEGDFEPAVQLGEGVILISRSPSALTPLETWALDSQKQLEPFRLYNHNTGPAVLEQADGTLHYGQVTAIHRENYRSPVTVQMTVVDDPSDLAAAGEQQTFTLSEQDRLYSVKTPHVRDTPTYDPRTAIPVGSRLTEDVPTNAGAILNAGSVVQRTGYRLQVYDPVRDKTVEIQDRGILAGKTAAPADLPTEVFDQWGIPSTTVADLRTGDIVDSRDIDANARISQRVRVLSDPVGGSSRVEIRYAPVEGGHYATGRRATDRPVTIHSRTVACLSDNQRLHVLNPGTELVDISTLTPGTKVLYSDWQSTHVVTFVEHSQTGYSRIQQAHFVGSESGQVTMTGDGQVVVLPPGLTTPHTHGWPTDEQLKAGPQPAPQPEQSTSYHLPSTPLTPAPLQYSPYGSAAL